MTEGLLLPPASRLVHIGPHKTGTTALQWALHERRAELDRHGVHYAGGGSQAYRPALGLTGRSGRRGTPPARERWWTAFVDEVRGAGDKRVVVSSESLANAETEHIVRLADDLGRDRVHVVRMVRRYDKMLASQWQQTVTQGRRRDLEPWVAAALRRPDHGFWSRHGFATLTRRWADVVGADRTTVVVVDESDRGWLPHVFEEMLGLEPGLLVLDRSHGNRSLLRAEAELLRQLNGVLARLEWVGRVHLTYLRSGISHRFREMPTDPLAGRVGIDPACQDALVAATERDLAALGSLGVRVVGDTAWLTPEIAPLDGVTPSLSLESAATAVSLVVERAVAERFPLTEAEHRPITDLAPETRLSAEAERLLRGLEAVAREDGWPEAVIERYLHEGAAAGLRAMAGCPEAFSTVSGAESLPVPEGRFAPRLVAAAVAGTIAASDSRLDP